MCLDLLVRHTSQLKIEDASCFWIESVDRLEGQLEVLLIDRLAASRGARAMGTVCGMPGVPPLAPQVVEDLGVAACAVRTNRTKLAHAAVPFPSP